jgi:hypothetical protein
MLLVLQSATKQFQRLTMHVSGSVQHDCNMRGPLRTNYT